MLGRSPRKALHIVCVCVCQIECLVCALFLILSCFVCYRVALCVSVCVRRQKYCFRRSFFGGLPANRVDRARCCLAARTLSRTPLIATLSYEVLWVSSLVAVGMPSPISAPGPGMPRPPARGKASDASCRRSRSSCAVRSMCCGQTSCSAGPGLCCSAMRLTAKMPWSRRLRVVIAVCASWHAPCCKLSHRCVRSAAFACVAPPSSKAMEAKASRGRVQAAHRSA